MTTVAIDIQPQFRFTCMAANANHFLHQPENMVKELNRQAAIADKRMQISVFWSRTSILIRRVFAPQSLNATELCLRGKVAISASVQAVAVVQICWMVCRHLLIMTM